MQRTSIVFERISGKPVSKQYVEIVERKGLGHPDYIIDSVCEAASVALSRYYLENFGRVYHHNLDKGLLVGGRSTPVFGGGTVDEPIYILIAGRATTTVRTPTNEYVVPVEKLLKDALRTFIKKNFRFLDPDKHIVSDCRIRPGSADLVKIVEYEKSEVPLSNDTSFGVGYAPFTVLEKIVYSAEREINSPAFKQSLRESGEDCKVMGLRKGDKIHLTIADGIVSHLTPDLDHYISVKEEIRDRILDKAVRMSDGMSVTVDVNTGDLIVPNRREESSVYLTVTGTSAEHGDDGNTGRGNRASGLITPCRQMSLEATAGKNPISHVGKIYNVAAYKIADKIYDEVRVFDEVYVKLLAQIGRRIDRPLMASIQYISGEKITSGVKYEVEEIVRYELKNITALTDSILRGEARLF
ncbi:MAG: methionine adenosyltransferase [Nitrososphaerota archaeon]|nr:methionine adenosyltransferase [Candidatus Calditenuaceae archaeon]MDW8072782.1 methionine adenosyltransferase [Nitrososphaerota archaeon]